MKKIIISLLVIAVVVGLVSTATFAFFTDTETSPPAPTEVCAVAVRSFDQGLTAGGGAVPPERSDPSAALGPPDAGEIGDFVSLGFGGEIVLDFGTYVCGSITIWEVTWGAYPDETAGVEAMVEASPDGESWTYLGEADNTTNPGDNIHPTTIDLGDEHIRYVKITDTTDPSDYLPDRPEADAFDLTAVCAWTCESNIFQAGIIDLLLEQEGTIVVDGEFTDLKPCQTGYLKITLTATENSNPMDVWKHIFEVTTDENGVTEPEQAWYDEFNGGEPKNDIDHYIHFDMWIELGGDPWAFDEGIDIMLIDESEGWMVSDVECFWIYLGVLDPAGILGPPSITIIQSFHMDADVENWAQSDCMTFLEEFFGQQIVGNPPLPGDELPGHGKPTQ